LKGNAVRPLTKIMVVEDESIVAKDLEMTLKRLGYSVPATAASAADALAKAAKHRPDLVLMDIHLHGEIDGIAVAHRLRSEMDIPVIYLTAYADDDTVARARETEPFGYLLKPFNERELRSMLEVAIYKHDAEARLRHSDRMASIGTMAAGVAHEINNPLAYVIVNLDFAAKSIAAVTAELTATPRDPGQADHLVERLRGASTALEDAGTGADRVRKIVADVSRFAQARETDRAPIDLWEALESAIRLSSHHLQHHAVIVREPSRVPRVLASTQGLEQVFINLLVNASQAMPEGRPQANRIHVVTRTDDAGRAVVEIADTGAGLTAAVKERIFDPFFTTKPVGLGTGLGLSICHRIISDFGGTITVESAPGSGTLFRITLPPAPAEKAAKQSPAPPRGGLTPRGQILVVDDDAKVLAMLDRILSHRHDVTLTSDGTEALALITAGRRFDLVLCDLMMPTMNGMELFERVETIAPEQASGFVFLCGGAVTQRAAEFLDAHAGQRFDKPFQLHELETMIAERLFARE
jgi:signal transduction histidine kinase